METLRGTLAALFLLTISPLGFGQNAPVFAKPIAADLTPAQSKVFQGLKNLPTSKSVTVIGVDPGKLKSGPSAVIELGGLKNLQILKKSSTEPSPGRLDWVGTVVDDLGGDATIAVNGQNVSASIRGTAGTYTIRPLGNGAHALVEIDPTKFPADHPPNGDQKKNTTP